MFDLESLKRPTSPEEAFRDLTETGGVGLYLAGGTIVVPSGSQALDFLVDLSRVGLDYVRVEEADETGGRVLVIGAMTRIADLIDESALDEHPWRAIRQACTWLATHTVRNRATVGGNITAAHFPSDLPPVLVALGADVVLQRSDGRRRVALNDFYARGSKVHTRGDLILEVRVPAGPKGRVAAFEKTGRTRADVAIVNCAAALTLDGASIESGGIVLGGLGAVPVTAAEAQSFLTGKKAEPEVLREAGRLVGSGVSARTDHRASAEYRVKVAGVIAERALVAAVTLGPRS